ncbi:MAG: sigma 54-interacting transcriptional regulator [Desulfoferrobacter sp.]
MARILVIDDEESIRFSFERFLGAAGHTVSIARDVGEALAKIAEADPDLVVADIILEDGTGIDVLREIRQRKLNCPVIMITGDPNVDTAAEAVRLGAFDYLPKPVTKDALLRAVTTALRYKAVSDEKEVYRSNLEAIFRSVKDPIITMDKDAAVIEMNEAAANSCGFSRQAIGRQFKELATGCNGRCVAILDEAIRRKEYIEAKRIECHPGTGPSKVINLSAFPLLDPQSVFKGVVMVFRDETRLVDLEKELKDHKQFHRLVGGCEKMQKVYSLIESLAGTQTTVLITGESGTGKELVAEALHSGDDRSHQPLVKVNCSALPENLLESELFGHVKGAFTGAVRDRIGRFQKAHGGSIFLDEIGDLSPKIQAQLLRVLQEKEFERVGDSTPIKVDVRVIAATNKDLREMVQRGEFREDLFYRLKVVEVAMPPLRERRGDIQLLVDHFRRKFNKMFGKGILTVSNDVMKVFLDYDWPGNVRELEHTMERAFVLCRTEAITLDQLPTDILSAPRHSSHLLETEGMDELQSILGALQKTGWNKAKAARLLGIDRATLYRKLQKFNITDDSSEK